MSIEQEIAELRKSIDRLADAIGAAPPASTSPAPAAEATPAPKAAPAAAPAPKAAPAATDEQAPTVTRDDCAKAITEAAGAGKRSEVVALLGKYKAQKLADLQPEHYGEFYAALQALA